ncbi:MAG: DsbA family protein [bacterium]|nr:DsbA family protein [bacterium]
MDIEIIPEGSSAATEKRSSSLDINKLILPVAILIAAVLVSGTLLYVNRDKLGSADTNKGAQIVQGDEEGKADVSVDDDPVLGHPNATVTIVEFSDFQCPFCRKFWEDAYVQIKKEYIDTGKVKLVFRDFPLDFHPAAEPSAQAAECADDQGKFWEYHDKIFSAQALQGQGTVSYGVPELKKWAQETNLNTAQFNQCLDSGKYKEEVSKDLQAGSALGVSGTPTLFVNGRRVIGAQPFATFKAIIDQELAGVAK